MMSSRVGGTVGIVGGWLLLAPALAGVPAQEFVKSELSGAGGAAAVLAQAGDPTAGVAPVVPPTTEATPDAGRLEPMQWVSVALLAAAPLVLVVLWFRGVLRPGGLDGRSVDGEEWWAFAGAGFLAWLAGGIGGAMAVAMVLGARAGATAGGPVGVPTDVRSAALATLGMAGLGLLAGLLLVRFMRRTATGAGLGFRWIDVPVGLGLLLLVYPVLHGIGIASNAVAHAVTGEAPDQVAHRTLEMLREVRGAEAAWAVVLGACAVLLIPAAEEIVFRGFAQSAVLRLTRRAWLSVLVTSAFFAFVHAPGAVIGAITGQGGGDGPVQLQALPTLWALGVAMGAAYERTRSLGVPIVMHMGFNALNVGLALGTG
jgi:membrane protease YdiL (CAAX protease family)